MKLQDLQSEFQKIILDAECDGADWVAESAQDMSSLERMAIYHNAYRVRLVDVLLDTFEHTAIYLGDDWFRQLASAYVQSQHSTHTNIGFYGREFPIFLADELKDDGEISELALMDWTLRRAFDGSDSSVMRQEDLQMLADDDDPDISLQAVPTLSIIKQRFNTLDIWQAINNDVRPAEARTLDKPLKLLVWRKGHSPYFRSLTELESAALDCLRSTCSLNEVGSVLEKEFPDEDVATEFGIMLQRWLQDELIRGH